MGNVLTKRGSVASVSWGLPERTLSVLKQLAGNAEKVLIVDPLVPAGGLDELGSVAVEVVPAAPGDENVEAFLREYSLPGLFSISKPTRNLSHIYPSLIEVSSVKVEQIEFQKLFARIASLPKPINLIIEMPGFEAEFLQRMAGAGLLQSVDDLRVLSMSEVFFEGAVAADVLSTRLRDLGLIVESVDDDDPDWPLLSLGPDYAARIASLEVKLAERDMMLSGIQASVEALKVQLGSELSEKAQLVKSLAETEARSKALEEKVRASEGALVEARAATEAREKARAETEARAKALEEKVRASEAALAEARAATEAREKARAETEARAKALEEKVRASEAALAEARAEHATLVRERDTLRTDTSTARSRVVRLEQDAETLKVQLSKNVETIRALEGRVKELEFRLTAAREEFHRAEGQINLLSGLLVQETQL